LEDPTSESATHQVINMISSKRHEKSVFGLSPLDISPIPLAIRPPTSRRRGQTAVITNSP